MNAPNLARNAYMTPEAPLRSGRSVEYDLFARITRRLRDCRHPGSEGIAGLAAALHDNLRLWTTLAVDLADEGNALPRDLRARLFYLAEFTRVHTGRVLSSHASPDILIEINTSVMRGLANQAGPG